MEKETHIGTQRGAEKNPEPESEGNRAGQMEGPNFLSGRQSEVGQRQSSKGGAWPCGAREGEEREGDSGFCCPSEVRTDKHGARAAATGPV